jgi:hypothetical protein
MTPPIGFRTNSNIESKGGNVVAATQTLPLSGAPAETTLPSISPIADYAYRIAALTAGLALITTFL